MMKTRIVPRQPPPILCAPYPARQPLATLPIVVSRGIVDVRLRARIARALPILRLMAERGRIRTSYAQAKLCRGNRLAASGVSVRTALCSPGPPCSPLPGYGSPAGMDRRIGQAGGSGGPSPRGGAGRMNQNALPHGRERVARWSAAGAASRGTPGETRGAGGSVRIAEVRREVRER